VRQRREAAIANTTGIRTLAAIAEAVPVRLMKRDLLFVAERLASLLDENRLSIVARRYGIKKAKDTDSLGKLFAAYLRRAEESILGSVLIETTILYMSTRHNPAQVFQEAATTYKVDTDAIVLKVKPLASSIG
jgi:ParB family transcriptional regulator, chromosome partitioning protein